MSLDGAAGRLLLHTTEFPCDSFAADLVLLLPFTAAYSRQMEPFGRAMQDRGCHAVAVDLPGHGRSSGPRGQFAIDDLLRTLRQLLDHYRQRFPASRIALAGSSWGGDLAILYSLCEEHWRRTEGREPAVASVLAQAVITPWQRRCIPHFRPELALLFDPLGRQLARLLVGKRLAVSRMFRWANVYQRTDLRLQAELDPLVLRSYDPTSYFGYLAYQPPVSPAELRLPLLLLHGENDRLVSARYEQRVFAELAMCQGPSRLELIPGAGHGMFEEQTDQIADLTCAWLAETASKCRVV